MFKRLISSMYGLGPSNILTLILGPAFIAYGTGLLLGYRETLIKVLGLPTWVYAAMFIVAGILKLMGIIFKWGRFSHTIGVTVATFWSSAILALAPSVAGWVGALPWVAIALIALFAATWPEPFNPVKPVRVIELSPDQPDPLSRATDFTKPVVRNLTNDDDTSER